MTGPIFADRTQAGRQLADRLLRFKGQEPVVLALPRGGVPVALEVAKKLGAPLDLVLVRKTGLPFQPELAYGAVVDGEHPEIVVNEKVERFLHLSREILDEQSARELEEIKRRRELYLAGRPRAKVHGRTVLIVDDGIATGMTVRAALKAIRRAQPKKLVLAAPIAPSNTVEELRADADEVVCLATPEEFYAISLYYTDFHQISDQEVIALLKQTSAESTRLSWPDPFKHSRPVTNSERGSSLRFRPNCSSPISVHGLDTRIKNPWPNLSRMSVPSQREGVSSAYIALRVMKLHENAACYCTHSAHGNR